MDSLNNCLDSETTETLSGCDVGDSRYDFCLSLWGSEAKTPGKQVRMDTIGDGTAIKNPFSYFARRFCPDVLQFPNIKG